MIETLLRFYHIKHERVINQPSNAKCQKIYIGDSF